MPSPHPLEGGSQLRVWSLSVGPLPAGSLPTCTCPGEAGPLLEKSHFN